VDIRFDVRALDRGQRAIDEGEEPAGRLPVGADGIGGQAAERQPVLEPLQASFDGR